MRLVPCASLIFHNSLVYVVICDDFRQVIELLNSEEDPSGSTGVVVWYDGRRNILTVAGVGDSLCVLSRNGRAILMNKMHRLDIPQEKDRVKSKGGTVINNR